MAEVSGSLSPFGIDGDTDGSVSTEDVWSPSLRADIFQRRDWSDQPSRREETPAGYGTSHSLSTIPTHTTQQSSVASRHNLSLVSPHRNNTPQTQSPNNASRRANSSHDLQNSITGIGAHDLYASPLPRTRSQISDDSQISWNLLSSDDDDESSSSSGETSAIVSRNPNQPNHHLTQSRPFQHDSDGFIDLTNETPPHVDMPSNNGERPSKRRRLSPSSTPRHSQHSQRRKTDAGSSSDQPVVIPAVEEVDLRDDDDDDKGGLSKMLEKQREATIKAQQEQAAKPVKLANLQCIICMDAMKDVTATSCGKCVPISCLRPVDRGPQLFSPKLHPCSSC